MRTKLLLLLLPVPRPFNSSLFYFRTIMGFKMLYLCSALIVLLHALVHEASAEGLHFKLPFSVFFRFQYGPMKSCRLYDDIFLSRIQLSRTIRTYNYLRIFVFPGTAHQLLSSSRSRIKNNSYLAQRNCATKITQMQIRILRCIF